MDNKASSIRASPSSSISDPPAAKRKILILATAGGTTNATPVLEIGKVLHSRGYTIEFGTLEGQEYWANQYDFVSKIHILGPGTSKQDEERNYLRMTDWKIKGLTDSWNPVFDAKSCLENTWPYVFSSLRLIMEDPAQRPDFIFADYLVEAARDMSHLYGVPIAMHWPQMPTAMLKTGYTPGIPGLSVDVLTSEHATFWQRLKNELMLMRMLPPLIRYKQWRKAQRANAGIGYDLPAGKKPDHLVLVNSFFGLTPAIDMPPNVVPVGPVLSDTFQPIDPQSSLSNFIDTHRRTLFISMGTHALLSHTSTMSLLAGATHALFTGSIDGIVWAIRGMARKQLDLSSPAPLSAQIPKDTFPHFTVGDILANAHPHIHVTEFLPQRAVLSHPHTALFITHGGASSTNEACYHGVPTICLGVYFDQLQNSMRLRDAGVGISLDHHSLTIEQLASSIERIVTDADGCFARNAERVARIARIASRRKNLAADMIEEVMADCEGRAALPQPGTSRVEAVRPSHLETADMRMPYWKRKNLDLKALGAIFLIFQVVILTRIPLAWS